MEAAGDPETSSPLPSSAAITAARGEGVTPHPDTANKMVVNYNNEQLTNKQTNKKHISKKFNFVYAMYHISSSKLKIVQNTENMWS